MHIELPPVDERYIKGKVAEGYFTNVSEAVRHAIRRMREIEETQKTLAFQALIAVGLEQAERGQVVPYTPELFENIIKQAAENARLGLPVKNEVKY